MSEQKELNKSCQSDVKKKFIVCAGVSCLDLFLKNTSPLPTPESVSLVESVEFVPGGSTSNTARAIANVGEKSTILTLLGDDSHADLLISQWSEMGIDTSLVRKTQKQKTALSVLPVYPNGKRGIYFCCASNTIMTVNDLIPSKKDATSQFCYRFNHVMKNASCFHYGYPHLSEKIQGEALKSLFESVRGMYHIFTSLDINGATKETDIIFPSLPFVDLFHANAEEALIIANKLDKVKERIDRENKGNNGENRVAIIEDLLDLDDIEPVASTLLDKGVTIVTITLGSRGVYTKITNDSKKLERFLSVLGMSTQQGEKLGFVCGRKLLSPAYRLAQAGKETATITNTTGAGDSFVGGLLSAFSYLCSQPYTMKFEDIINLSQITALRRLSGMNAPTTLPLLMEASRKGFYKTIG